MSNIEEYDSDEVNFWQISWMKHEIRDIKVAFEKQQKGLEESADKGQSSKALAGWKRLHSPSLAQLSEQRPWLRKETSNKEIWKKSEEDSNSSNQEEDEDDYEEDEEELPDLQFTEPQSAIVPKVPSLMT